MLLSPCRVCQRKYVPELLLATIDCPETLQKVGSATVLQVPHAPSRHPPASTRGGCTPSEQLTVPAPRPSQARVCRVKKSAKGESHATAVSQ
eukprot:1346425-Prymnesium_polylepis.1